MARMKSMSELIGIGELKKLSFVKALFAEFIGSLFLVLIGCGACLGDTNVVRIALTFGIAVATLAQALGHVSGCHINPAVTIGMLVARCVSLIRAVCYIAVQACGAIAGAAILYGLVPDQFVGSLGNTVLNENVTSGQGFGIEMMITFLLVLTVFAVCDERRIDIKGSAPLAIGLSITVCHLFAVPLTGSSMNPTRSLGPAVIMADGAYWENHWVYWVGPLCGGLSAGLIYSYVFRESKNLPSSADIEIGKHERYQCIQQGVKVYWGGPAAGGILASILYSCLFSADTIPTVTSEVELDDMSAAKYMPVTMKDIKYTENE